MVKVRIMGIAGSPRHGSTDFLVNEALAAAKELGDVETEFISLAGKKINPCNSCYACFKKPSLESLCYQYKDDANEIVRRIVDADGIVVGSPVYFGTITATLKALIDRTMPLEALGLLMRNKIGGVVTVAHDRSGGQEETVKTIHNWFLTMDMIVVSVGPERPGESIVGYYGAMATAGWPDSKIPWEDLTAVKEDKRGVYAARCLGKRVTEVAKVFKAGFASVPVKEMAWPPKAH